MRRRRKCICKELCWDLVQGRRIILSLGVLRATYISLSGELGCRDRPSGSVIDWVERTSRSATLISSFLPTTSAPTYFGAHIRIVRNSGNQPYTTSGLAITRTLTSPPGKLPNHTLECQILIVSYPHNCFISLKGIIW